MIRALILIFIIIFIGQNSVAKKKDDCEIFYDAIIKNNVDLELFLPNTFTGLAIENENSKRYQDHSVYQTLRINSINFIDELNSNFEINYSFENSWFDTRLAKLYKEVLINKWGYIEFFIYKYPDLFLEIYTEYKDEYSANEYTTEYYINLAKEDERILKLHKQLINDQETLFLKHGIIDKNPEIFLTFVGEIWLGQLYDEEITRIFFEEYATSCKLYDSQIIEKNLGIWDVDSSITNIFSQNKINESRLLNFIFSSDNFNEYFLGVFSSYTNTNILSSKMNFKSFPFDKQNLSIIVDNQYNDSFRDYFNTEVVFDNFSIEYDEKNNFLYEWDIKVNDAEIKYDENILTVNIVAERNANYYVYKVFAPIFLILLVCWSVLFIHPSQLESRLTVSIVCFLTLIAYNFVIDENLPKLGYLTLVDYFILISYIFSALPTLLSIFQYRIRENVILSKYIAKIRFYGFPIYVFLIFIVLNITSNINLNNTNNFLKAITL